MSDPWDHRFWTGAWRWIPRPRLSGGCGARSESGEVRQTETSGQIRNGEIAPLPDLRVRTGGTDRCPAIGNRKFHPQPERQISGPEEPEDPGAGVRAL